MKHTKGTCKIIDKTNIHVGCFRIKQTVDSSEIDLSINETGYTPKQLAEQKTELLKVSKLLYNLCKGLADMINYNNFDLIREEWNKTMTEYERVIKKTTQ